MPLIYTGTFSAVAVTGQQDLFELTVPAAGIVLIHEIMLAQTSDQGDAAAEALQLLLIRGHATSGSPGSAFTPLPLNSKITQAAATAVEINNTTIASAGTPVNLFADAWNIQAGYSKIWTPETRPVFRNSERVVLRQSAPADSITMSGTIVFEEL
jgi:hypothetical protein